LNAEDSRESVSRALAELGWEVRKEEAVIGAHGKHYVMVSFEDGAPSSVIISYVGKGGGLLSGKWRGSERLPSPQKVVKALSSTPG
jgi:hypothetical protein